MHFAPMPGEHRVESQEKMSTSSQTEKEMGGGIVDGEESHRNRHLQDRQLAKGPGHHGIVSYSMSVKR